MESIVGRRIETSGTSTGGLVSAATTSIFVSLFLVFLCGVCLRMRKFVFSDLGGLGLGLLHLCHAHLTSKDRIINATTDELRFSVFKLFENCEVLYNLVPREYQQD